MRSRPTTRSRPIRTATAALLALLLCCTLFGTPLVSPALPAHAAGTVVVNTLGDGAGACPGTCTLRAAIGAANPGDTIAFSLAANSVITLVPANGPLLVTKSLTIDGSAVSGLAVDGATATTVFSVTAGPTVIENLTVQHGAYQGSGYLPNACDDETLGGGGIYNSAALTLTNDLVTNNDATNYPGGGVYNDCNATLALVNTSVTANNTGYEGGGIYTDGALTLDATSVISGNGDLFNSGTMFGGGGIYVDESGSAVLNGATVSNNTADYRGGGIYADNNVIVNSGSTISNNTVTDTNTDDPAGGGGIYNSNDGALSITGATISNNTVNGDVYDSTANTAYGGGVFTRGQFSLANSVVSGNTANGNYGNGGGIDNGDDAAGGTMFITNTQILSNTATGYAPNGGGIENYSGSATLTGATVDNNQSVSYTGYGGDTPYGGGIDATGALTITNSSIDNNTAYGGDYATGGGIDIYSGGALTMTTSSVSGNTLTSYAATGAGIALTYTASSATVISSTVQNNSAASALQVSGSAVVQPLARTTHVARHRGDRDAGSTSIHSTALRTRTHRSPIHTTAISIHPRALGPASTSGGAFYLGDPSDALTILATTVYSNVAGYGGALENLGQATFANSTVYSNTALDLTAFSSGGNGGAFDNDSTLAITNSTVVSNTAPYGTGDGLQNNTNATASFANTIISGSGQGACSGGVLDNQGNIDNDGTCGFTTNSLSGVANLGLGSFGNNGGPTYTVALLPTSPAVGLGIGAICQAAPINGLDQRGFIRNPLHCDSGAYEVSTPAITVMPLTLAGGILNQVYPTTAISAIYTGPGTAPITYTYVISSGSLPPGLNLDRFSGLITGTPTQTGTFTMTITVEGIATVGGNPVVVSGSRQYVIVVTASACAINGAITVPYLGWVTFQGLNSKSLSSGRILATYSSTVPVRRAGTVTINAPYTEGCGGGTESVEGRAGGTGTVFPLGDLLLATISSSGPVTMVTISDVSNTAKAPISYSTLVPGARSSIAVTLTP